MSLPSFVQHLKVLESSGLVRSEKLGRVRTCHVMTETLTAAEHWLAERRRLWQRRLDALADYVEGDNPTE
jgi:DNA-binding transcriptional ArsR family regulator